jgi:hypothetical protein
MAETVSMFSNSLAEADAESVRDDVRLEYRKAV